MDPKAVFGISIIIFLFNGNNIRIDILFIKIKIFLFCDYRLIGKSFIFQVNIVGSNPTNHKIIGEMAEWLKAVDCKSVELIST